MKRMTWCHVMLLLLLLVSRFISHETLPVHKKNSFLIRTVGESVGENNVSGSANWTQIAKKEKKVCCYQTHGLAPCDMCQTARINLFMWNRGEDTDKEKNVTD